MNQTTAFLKRHSLVLGIVLMFLFTWPLDLVNSGIVKIDIPFIFLLFLGWGFGLASVIMTGLTLGKQGVVSLLKRYIQWRVGWKWYLAAFLLEPVLQILGVYGNALITGVAPDYSRVMAYKVFGEGATLWLFIVPFFITDLISNGEEIGWRGYALPRLQAKYSALSSTLILGVIWGFWHLLKFLPHWNPLVFAFFMLHTVSFAVILSWLYNNTKGSLLLVAMMHASANTAGIFLPMADTLSNENLGAYVGYVLFQVIAAILIVITSGPARLSRTEPMQIQGSDLPNEGEQPVQTLGLQSENAK